MPDDIQKIEDNHGQIAQNVKGDQKYYNVYGDLIIDNSNKSIKSLLISYYDFRKKMIGFILKFMIAWFLFFTLISVLGMKYSNFDNFFNIFASSFMSIILLIIYLLIAKKYYKIKRKRKHLKDEAAVLAFFDLLMISVFYYINFVA